MQNEITLFGLLETEERSSTVLLNIENHSSNNDTANIREDLSFQQHHCENLKSRKENQHRTLAVYDALQSEIKLLNIRTGQFKANPKR
jgi:hypothetical protein